MNASNFSQQAPILDAQVVVHSRGTGYAQEIVVGSHQLNADEPVSVGGMDTGPTPYDLLLAALGACTAMTVRSRRFLTAVL